MELKSLLLSPAGRIGRKTYWLSALGLGIVNAALQGIAWAALNGTAEDGHLQLSFATGGAIVVAVVLVAMVVLGISGLMISIKRCHDRDRSGWFVLASLIPVVGPFWVAIELGFLRGTVGPNRFGSDPAGGPMLSALAA